MKVLFLACSAFVIGAGVSLRTSWILVARIERIAQRFGHGEALVGLIAALAGDSPEITSAVTAMVRHDRAIGAGVVLGSNVFNLAALLGLGAVLAGTIAVHRRVILLSGTIASLVALSCLLAVTGLLSAPVALALALAVLLPYVAVLALSQLSIARIPLPESWVTALGAAVQEEVEEYEASVHLPRAGRRDAVAVAGSLTLVVAASIAMEDAASYLGAHWSIPGIITGGVVLAAVTSIPNAVAAVYLARRRRGIAVLSTALNSNTVNAIAGFLVPAAIVGSVTGATARDVGGWYLGFTLAVLALAYRDAALRRRAGIVVIAAYLVFVASLVLATFQAELPVAVAAGGAVGAALLLGALVLRPGQRVSPLLGRGALGE